MADHSDPDRQQLTAHGLSEQTADKVKQHNLDVQGVLGILRKHGSGAISFIDDFVALLKDGSQQPSTPAPTPTPPAQATVTPPGRGHAKP